jgi:pyruvate,water dikinase
VLQVITFGDAEPDVDLVGGKGANLVRLVRAGLDVPPGFCLTTEAYRLATARTQEPIAELVADLDPADPVMLDAVTADVRDLIETLPLPGGLAASLAAAYEELGGEGVRVAVRSSGTAEDLAGTSFAGLHDTFLGVRGIAQIEAAVKRCWASMWSARATAYRAHNGFDHDTAALAVVVQQMAPADVAGVLFTADPRTGHTGHTVVNANWGLGESVVSGEVDPDEFVIDSAAMRVIARRTGDKRTRYDRRAGSGTCVTEVSEPDRNRPSLTDDQLVELTRLGLRVQDHYGGIPQDLEWALVGDRFVLLQARPVTGVELSWDHVVDGWQTTPEVPGTLWTRVKSEEMWNGAKTPLFYSIRARQWQLATDHLVGTWAVHDAAGLWFWKFHRGEAYYNTALQGVMSAQACPPPFRVFESSTLAPAERDGVLAAPFDWMRYLGGYLDHERTNPQRGFFRWGYNARKRARETTEEARRLLAVDVRGLTDDELTRHVDTAIEAEGEYWHDVWVPFFLYFRDTTSLLTTMVMSWYDGENPYVAAELLTGVGEQRSFTMEETHRLWMLADRLRRSDELRLIFDASDPGTYLDRLAATPDGQAWVRDYRDFLDEYGYRGSTDRDMYFDRRAENPALDHQALRTLLESTDHDDPDVRARRLNERRDAAVSDVIANIGGKSMGSLRILAFNAVLTQVLEGLEFREDSRAPTDATVLAAKVGCREIGRRLVERGRLSGERDFYFLSRDELYALLRGTERRRLDLVRAKVTQRAADFDAVVAGERELPVHLRDGMAEGPDPDGSGAGGDVLRGNPTSRGTVRGSPGSCAASTTSAGCGRGTSWSAPPPTPAGPRCSAPSVAWCWNPVGCWPTGPACPASTGCRAYSWPAPPGWSPTAPRSRSTATPAR